MTKIQAESNDFEYYPSEKMYLSQMFNPVYDILMDRLHADSCVVTAKPLKERAGRDLMFRVSDT